MIATLFSVSSDFLISAEVGLALFGWEIMPMYRSSLHRFQGGKMRVRSDR